ncbi:hypothetical protein YC2023_065460 [Brassica napus]
MKIYKNREKEFNRPLPLASSSSLSLFFLFGVTDFSPEFLVNLVEATDVCGLSGALAKRGWVGESKDGRALLSSSVSWLQLVPVRFCWLVARSVDVFLGGTFGSFHLCHVVGFYGISGLTGTVLLNLYGV